MIHGVPSLTGLNAAPVHLYIDAGTTHPLMDSPTQLVMSGPVTGPTQVSRTFTPLCVA